MLNENALVSVIMPAYNAERYIEESLASVLNQSHKNIELIIINDCSTDNTLNIIKGISQKESRLVILNNTENLGCAESRNRALAVARGKYIAFCDSDDIWLENKIEKQLRHIVNENADMVFTAYEMVDSNDSLIKYRNIKTKVVMDDLLKENIVIFSSTVFRRNAIENIRFRNEWFHEDYVFLLECLKRGICFKGIDEYLVKYRVHKQGRSFNKFGSARYRWKIYRDFLHLNMWESFYFFSQYTVNGLKKYG